MQKKEKVILLLLVLALLFIGAYFLYDYLAARTDTEQLAASDSVPNDGVAVPDEDAPAENENAAPDFTVYDAEGNAVQLSDYFGKPIVLNFWASWCGPCKMEMPEFEEKYQEIGDEIQFLCVNVTDGQRETQEVAAGYVEAQGYTLPILYDLDQDAAMTYYVYSLPTTYFIDADGALIAQATGAIDGATLQKGIDMITEE